MLCLDLVRTMKRLSLMIIASPWQEPTTCNLQSTHSNLQRLKVAIAIVTSAGRMQVSLEAIF